MFVGVALVALCTIVKARYKVTIKILKMFVSRLYGRIGVSLVEVYPSCNTFKKNRVRYEKLY